MTDTHETSGSSPAIPTKFTLILSSMKRVIKVLKELMENWGNSYSMMPTGSVPFLG